MKRKPALAAVSGLAALALVMTACGSDETKTISGEGSTAQQKAIEHFSNLLADNTDIVLDLSLIHI